MTKKIEYPEQKTFFICWDEQQTTITAYGEVDTYQCMETKQPILNQYLNEQEWVDILMDNGINPNPDDGPESLEVPFGDNNF